MAYYGGVIGSAWQAYINVTSISSNNTHTTVYFTYGVNLTKKLSDKFEYKYNSSNWSIPTSGSAVAAGWHQLGSSSFTYARGHANQTVSFSFWLKHGGSGSKWKGTSTATAYASIPQKPSYVVSYNLNSPNETSASNEPLQAGDEDGMVYAMSWQSNSVPSNQTKWYGEQLALSSEVPELEDIRYAFLYWNEDETDEDETTRKSPSDPYNENRALSLYAIWDEVFPPTATKKDFQMTGASLNGNGVKGFTGFSVICANPTTFLGKELVSATLVVGMRAGVQWEFDVKETVGDTTYYEDFELTIPPSLVHPDYGGSSVSAYIYLVDSEERTTTINLGNVEFVDPTWTKSVIMDGYPPPIADKFGVLDTVSIWNYTTEEYDIVTGKFEVTVISDGSDPEIPPQWTFNYTFDGDHVDPESSDMTQPTTKVKIEYKHYTSYEKPYREAFFNTTRNQNFSNGIYNVMFIGGVEDKPDFTSRIWWSKINDPTYFPDTNYLEIGSNDTTVMGLTKVGDYLGVVKQSKTTDTAIFLVYPTSFEEDTTFAVRQGVQGVGALARYSFNILGDETLFLSPNGVMAIVPSQDEEHKVQNRSYFIDGKLLEEPQISESYSFVFDGKYYLSTGNGAVYVLDGNQKNSWGNDKTNLVYECYYLNNIPARCFVKYGINGKNTLVFSTYDEVCAVGETYEDDFGYDDSGEKIEHVPVKAEWSTIFDDDGSLHYYKTMQKKGNLVSVLPRDNETPYKQVYIDEKTFNENKTIYFTLVGNEYVRCTEDDTFVFAFAEISVDESEFTADKTRYYVLSGGEYVQCTEESVFDEDETYYYKQGTYYIENRTNTKVFVKKDGNAEIEIERSFSLSSDIPSEMFLKKKFKKYKRLQFIIRNDAPEPFGVDSIIKNYTVGNYAKK